MAADEMLERVAVALIAPSARQLLLALRAQHGVSLRLFDETDQDGIHLAVHWLRSPSPHSGPPLPLPAPARADRTIEGLGFGTKDRHFRRLLKDGTIPRRFQGPDWS